MQTAWRIVKSKHAQQAFDGEGALRFGGRWNSPGTRVVYCSRTLALAALESLVHLNPPVVFRYLAIPLDFDDELLETTCAADLPDDWRERPPPRSAAEWGDRWVKEARSPALEIPSVIIPSESNLLLNPAHPDFRKIRIGTPQEFAFDPPLIAG